jgi:hypothetical protein
MKGKKKEYKRANKDERGRGEREKTGIPRRRG